MSYALVFSGQGTQHAGMLPWLQPDATLQALSRLLGEDWRTRLGDASWAGANAHAQPLLTATALAAWAQLQPLLEELGPPAIVCGYSVGELAAFSAAGVFDATTAMQLSVQRAACMDAAAAAGPPTGLLAIGGAPAGWIETFCGLEGLDIAIRLSPGQAVLGGLRETLSRAMPEVLAAGLQATPLNVALASHTRWMQPAVPAFAQHLQAVPLQPPRLALFSNARGRIRSAALAREALAQQLAHTVAWDDCLQAIAEQRVDAVLEIGPGQALAKMWVAREPEVPARSADEFRSAAAIANWLRRA